MMHFTLMKLTLVALVSSLAHAKRFKADLSSHKKLFPRSLAPNFPDPPTTPGPLNNIEYLGQGYDLLRGNPHGTDGRNDKGFRQQVFQATYEDGKTMTMGGAPWTIPDKTYAYEVHGCSTGFVSSVIQGEQTYLDSLKSSVSTDFTFSPVAFSASSDYKRIASGTSKLEETFTESVATCVLYSVKMARYAAPSFTPGFLNGMMSLPTVYDNKTSWEFHMFIETFGTHVMHGADFGGQWGQLSRFTKTEWSSILESELNVYSSASFSALLSAGVDTDTESEVTDAVTFSNTAEDQKLYNKGGEYMADEHAWMYSIWEKPMPVLYYLTSMDKLFHPNHFPGLDSEELSDLDKRRVALATALKNHCEKLLENGQVERCEKPAGDSFAPALEEHWMPWATSLRPHGRYASYDCPSGSFITSMTFRSLGDGSPLNDLMVTCSTSDGKGTGSSALTNDGAGFWTSSMQCPDGFSGIQPQDDGKRTTNVQVKCLGKSGIQEATGGAGELNEMVTCPYDTPVVSGVEILWIKYFGKGIANVRTKCSNDNLQ
jgi:hypothetical protein